MSAPGIARRAEKRCDTCAGCKLAIGPHDRVAYDRATGTLLHAKCATATGKPLTRCTDCGRAVPEYSRLCPHCGAGGDACWCDSHEPRFEDELLALENRALDKVRDRSAG